VNLKIQCNKNGWIKFSAGESR